MMKSFILAATSIAYLLSIANIADAKVKTSKRENLSEQSCLSQSATSNQVKPISTADIRSICQIITQVYGDLNRFGQKVQLQPYPREGDSNGNADVFSAYNVKRMELTAFSNLAENTISASIFMEVVERNYEYYGNYRTNGKWVFMGERDYSNIVRFMKKNGKWEKDERDKINGR